MGRNIPHMPTLTELSCCRWGVTQMCRSSGRARSEKRDEARRLLADGVRLRDIMRRRTGLSRSVGRCFGMPLSLGVPSGISVRTSEGRWCRWCRVIASLTDPAEVLRAIDGYEGQPITATALKLAPLVFVRPGELRGARWSEFDLDGAE